VIATIAIFLPAFLFVALSGPLLPRIRKSRAAGGVLDGVNVGSLALMAVVTWQLGRVAVVDLATVVLAALSVIALLRLRINPAWLMAAGAAIGLLVR
jgi:chromate transporter